MQAGSDATQAGMTDIGRDERRLCLSLQSTARELFFTTVNHHNNKNNRR